MFNLWLGSINKFVIGEPLFRGVLIRTPKNNVNEIYNSTSNRY